ncbi:hypothetical protein MRX96_010601 [Rhipicephalus microplus]
MEDIMEDYPLDDVENEDVGAPEVSLLQRRRIHRNNFISFFQESATAEGNCFEQEEAGEKVTPYTKKRVVQNPRPKLNKDRLAGSKGIRELVRMSKNILWRGQGHELHDLDTTMSLLEHWGHRLFPQMDSNNFFSNLERLGMKREIQTYMRKLRMGLEGDVGEQLQFGEDLDDRIIEEKEEQPPFEDPFSSLLADSSSQQALLEAPPSTQQPEDVSQELRERIEWSRQQALERRRLRLAQQAQLSRDMDTEVADLMERIPCPVFHAETAPPRTLNDVLDLVDAGGSGPSTLAILPSDNFAATVTGEESGDENDTDMARLPGSVLRAEIVGLDNASSDDDEGEPAKKVAKSSANWDKRDLKTKLPQSEWLAEEQDESFLTPADAFEKFFDDDVIALLVKETNRYADRKNRSLGVTEEKMKCVIGVLLLSGYVPVLRRRMLREISEDCDNELVANSMRRNRFEAIFSNLHVADNNNLPQDDRFAKMRPLFKFLNQKFLLYAPLSECYSIDESMCEYFGKHGCKQFLKGKPIRFGYKLWCLCTPLGYLLSTEPYQGKYGVAPESKNDLGLGGSVVVDMVGRLKSKTDLCFHVFFDNFFHELEACSKTHHFGREVHWYCP